MRICESMCAVAYCGGRGVSRGTVWRIHRSHLKPLETVLEALHALLADSGADAAGLQQHGLPFAPARDLPVCVPVFSTTCVPVIRLIQVGDMSGRICREKWAEKRGS